MSENLKALEAEVKNKTEALKIAITKYNEVSFY